MEILILSSLTIGFLHALAPDHWLPFVMLGQAQKWSKFKLSTITVLAGLGHVAASFFIGSIGLLLGIVVEQVELWETSRGNIASLLLIGFGIAYMVWGIKNWGRKHSHQIEKTKIVSYWTLFALIVFGPCEPLIPLLFAGYGISWSAVFSVFTVFSVATIGTMIFQVHIASYGISLLWKHKIEHASDVVAGGVIALTGVAIQVFGI